MKKDFLSVYDLTRKDFDRIFSHAATLKAMLKDGIIYQPLAGRTLGMIFDKSSTRTRLSFEAGMYQLGGLAIYLNSRDTQLGRGEPVSPSDSSSRASLPAKNDVWFGIPTPPTSGKIRLGPSDWLRVLRRL